MKRANRYQARKIERAILSVYDAADVQASIVDALTDLRHLCDVRGVAFHEDVVARSEVRLDGDGGERFDLTGRQRRKYRALLEKVRRVAGWHRRQDSMARGEGSGADWLPEQDSNLQPSG